MGITLEKGTPVSLTKTDAGLMEVILSWEKSGVDVDLACMIETVEDGVRAKPIVIQALDKKYGSISKAPFVALDRDVRTGGSTETLTVNLARSHKIVRALIFAFIYEGGTWGKAGNAKVQIKHPQGDYEFAFSDRNARSCVLVDLQNDGSGNLNMSREGTFFSGFHREIDQHYGWPKIDWVAGRK